MKELTEIYKQMMNEVSQARMYAQKAIDCKKTATPKSMEFLSIAQKKIDEIDSLHKIALTKLEEIKKEKIKETAETGITITASTEHKKLVADEGELWKGAHEVAVRAYNEVKTLILQYKQAN